MDQKEPSLMIESPIKGTVAAVYIEEGEDVGSMTAMKVVNSDMMKAIINVPENVVCDLVIGQNAEVWVDGDKSHAIEGEVTKFDLTTQGSMSLYPVEITVPNRNGKLLSGMFVEVEIILNEKSNSVVVDNKSVLTEGDMYYVYVVDQGVSKKTAIVKGLACGDKLEILDGVEMGERVVTSGHDYLKGGEKVKIIE